MAAHLKILGRVALFCFLSVVSIWQAHAGNDDKRVYRFGILPQFSHHEIYNNWRPILLYLEKSTGEKFEIVGTSDMEEFEKIYRKGGFDFVYLNSYQILDANRYQHYIPLLRDHGESMSGIVVVRTDSPITAVPQLEGKKVVFPARTAIGASLLMRAEFKRIFRIHMQPVYAGNHDSVYLSVVKGLSDAGSGSQKSLEKQPDSIRKQLRIIHRTQEIPTYPIAAHADVPITVRSAVVDALLDLRGTESGMMLLKEIPMHNPGPAAMNEYNAVRKLNLDEFVDGE